MRVDKDMHSNLTIVHMLQHDVRADLTGDCGGMPSDDDTDYIIQRLAGFCELVYFPGIGHSIHWMKPQELTQIIHGYCGNS